MIIISFSVLELPLLEVMHIDNAIGFMQDFVLESFIWDKVLELSTLITLDI